MKDTFRRVNSNGAIEFKCNVHGYLSFSKFFDSDVRSRRKSCQKCTSKRARISSHGDLTKRVLTRYKNFCRRNGHGNDVRDWERSDISSMIVECEINGELCLRQRHPERKIWSLNDVFLISTKDAKKHKFQHRRGARWIKGKSLAAMCLREANLSTGNTISREIQKA